MSGAAQRRFENGTFLLRPAALASTCEVGAACRRLKIDDQQVVSFRSAGTPCSDASRNRAYRS